VTDEEIRRLLQQALVALVDHAPAAAIESGAG